MPGEEQLDGSGLLALDLNGLPHDPHVLPAVPESVLVQVAGVELINVEILLIDGKDRQAECNLPIMSDGDPRQCRLTCSDHRHSGRIQMYDVAQGRHAMGAMRIVGQNRPTCCCSGACDNPVVRSDPVDVGHSLVKELLV